MFSVVLLAILGASLGGIVLGILFLWHERLVRSTAHYLVSFAVGVMLTAVFTDLLPELFALDVDTNRALLLVFGGILLFYILEQFLIVYHCHGTDECDVHGHATSSLIILGDTVHNFIDGMIIAGTFAIDPRLGFVTTIAVLCHELPQEVGDFAVLAHNGMRRGRIILVNIVSALASVLGGVIAWFASASVPTLTTIFLGLGAGNFLYIATADLLPMTRQERVWRSLVIHLIMVLVGIAVMMTVGHFVHE